MILIYGRGGFLDLYQERIDWDRVSAIIDKTAKKEEVYRGVRVIPPSAISQYMDEGIFVFSRKNYGAILEELEKSYQIPREYIFSWKSLVYDYAAGCEQEYQFRKQFALVSRIESMLDIHAPDLYQRQNSQMGFGISVKRVDGINSTTDLAYENKYQKLFKHADEILDVYDVIMVYTWNTKVKERLEKLKQQTRWILAYFSVLKADWKDWISNRDEIVTQFEQLGSLKREYTMNGVFFLVDTQKKVSHRNSQIYVVCHKPYKVKEDSLYRPLCVGNYVNPLYLDEKQGENISYLNPKINECTALYWIWKNTTSPIVGLNHYRRYFYNNALTIEDNYLEEYRINELLQEYDMIVPESVPFCGRVYDQLFECITDKEIFYQGYQVLQEAIEKHQPEYSKAFYAVMQGYHFYRCNLFVTRREIFDQYCTWLFSFLIEATELIHIKQANAVDSRIMGYFAERMLTVWLMKQNIHLLELPFSQPIE